MTYIRPYNLSRFTYKSFIAGVWFIFCFINYTTGQQVPRYSQYIMNEFIVNPAVAGLDGRTTVTLTGRKEWLGFGNGVPTPQSYSASFQTRFLIRRLSVKSRNSGNKLFRSTKGRVGIGATLINDYNGALQRLGFGLTYAYHIRINESQLSFGITASITQLQLRSKYLDFKDNTNETMLALANSSIWIPDFAVGINYIYRRFHVGFSGAQLLESSIIFGNSGLNLGAANIHFRRNYFLIGAYLGEFPSNPKWEYEPSTMVKMNDPVNFNSNFIGPKVQADMMVRLIYDHNYWFGGGYRTGNEFIVLGGLKWNKLHLTYSFDYGNNGITRYSYGSHEISISAKFGEEARRFLWKERY
jgi:type IX secretion system PorP/SprF family membrane protein